MLKERMAHPLDGRSSVTEFDPSGMLSLTEGFPAQCRQALAIATNAQLPTFKQALVSVILTGMGGSAVGGDFAQVLFLAQGRLPFSVNRDDHLPSSAGPGTLVFCASYSGNTEETLRSFTNAEASGATIVGVSSGGELSERCLAGGHTLISVPGGQPPRTAMGFMTVPVLVVCERLGLLTPQPYETCFTLLEACANDWTAENPPQTNPTKKLAEAFHGNLPILYGLGPAAGIVANRWKCQLHENSKTMAFANSFPELCHNEILGWAEADKQSVGRWVGAVLELGDPSTKMQARSEIVERLIGQSATFHHVAARGSDLMSQLFSLAFFGDFLSLYLARLMRVDPENIDAINTLKTELSKVD